MTTLKGTKRKKQNKAPRPNKMAKMESGKKRHHFVSFPSEAAQLNLTPVSSAIREVWADPDSPTTSIFHSRMQHWSDLNLSESFGKFSKGVNNFSSLPLVIHNKDKIFQKMKETILEKDELCLESMYDLCAAFALDLQQDFRPYLDDFIELVADSAKLKNAQIIKSCFDSLNQVIKMMLRSESSAPDLLQRTMKLFQLSIPPITHRLCAGALAQILRKSGDDLVNCINVLLSSSICQGLVELSGMIIVQSVKTTSKSIVANASKILEVSLECVNNYDWKEETDVTSLMSTLVENLEGLLAKDIDKISEAIVAFWAQANDIEKNINAKLTTMVQLIRLNRSKKLILVEKPAGKFLTRCLAVESVDLDTLVMASTCLCSAQSKEEGWSLLQNIIKMNISRERKAQLVNAISKLDSFEGAFLHRVVQYLTSHQDREEAIFLAVEGLWSYAESKLNNHDDSYFTIEFPCANPSDLNTLPNQLLLKLEKPGAPSIEWEKKQLTLLSVIRPLHQDVATELFKKTLQSVSKDEARIESLSLVIKALGGISCPKDFLKLIKSSDVLSTFRSNIDNPVAINGLAYIFSVGGSSDNDWIDSETKINFSNLLMTKFHVIKPENRSDLVTCLVHLKGKCDNFNAMLSAEVIDPTIQTYREKLKFLSMLTCPDEVTDDVACEANFRYLLSCLAINFSLLWDPCLKIIDTYFATMDPEKAWAIFHCIFSEVNARAAEDDESKVGIDFKNFRNLLLKSLDSFIHFAEKKNSVLAVDFLDVFLKGKQTITDPKGLAAFLGVYKQFINLRSVVRFEEVRALAERCLGDYLVKNREIAIDFFAAAFKELRSHKPLLKDLVDAKKWKSVFLTFPTEVLEQSEKFVELLCLIMAGKIRQTTKEKRKDQLASRKVIIRSIFQLGKSHGLEFLRLLHKQQVPFLNDDTSKDWEPYEISHKLDMIFDVYFLAANSAVTTVDGVVGGAKEIFSELIRILRFQGSQLIQKNTLKKRRPKVLEQLIQMFKALQAHDWTPEEENGILCDCIWPLLQPDSKDENDSTADQQTSQRTCYLTKIVTLFNLWTQLEKYQHWFFLQNGKGETVLDWIRLVFDSKQAADEFRQKLFTCICKFVIINSETKKERFREEFIQSLMGQFESWLLVKGKARGNRNDIPIRLNSLAIVVSIARIPEGFNEKLFFDSVISYAARGMGDIQTFAIAALNSLITRRKEPPPASAYKLLTCVVNNEENKLAVRKMLWKNTENLGISLNDKLLNGGAYKTILESKDGVTNRQFLFLLHYGASEIYVSDYTKRSSAGTCIRELIQVMKTQKSRQDYLHLVDSALLPVISRGLQSKNERVQSEFLEILLDAATDDGFVGSGIDISPLRNQTDDPELNFFDNMKHIQKHRRGRALRRFSTRLDENPDFLNVKCCYQIIYPLACSYLFNTDYTQQSDTILAAISCVGSLCAKFGWKEYKIVLLHFLKVKPSEPAHQKQRVKVLAAVLNAFHFASLDGETQNSAHTNAIKIIDSLLHKLRLQREDDEVDVALYVPILKILLLYPKKLNSFISTLFVQVARKLRSRLIEDRKLARDILGEMVQILGPNYFQFLLSVLEGSLQRGYQVHILVFSINTVMNAMESQTFPGCYDSSVPKILEFVSKELFGSLVEEKKVAAIVKKTPEAAKVVGYSILETLATKMSKSLVCDVLLKLFNSYSGSKATFDSLQKLRRAVRSVQQGLAKNNHLSRPADYLQLSFGILSGQLLPQATVKAHMATLREFAFSLLLAGTTGEGVTGAQVRPFWPYFREALDNKDVNVVVACLKFLTIATQTKEVCDVLIDLDDRDFVGVISSKCKQYQSMKNKQPYMSIAMVLRNLLTHGDKFESDHLKAICIFFEGCLDSNKDDTNAMRLLGLVLFRFYSADAYGPFLKLLCISCVQCRSESSFNVAKSILTKICRRHSTSFVPSMEFFVANINYEEEAGRRRSIMMANLLLESCPGNALNFESQGLFIEGATRLFNEYSQDCKKLLEDLLTTIIKIQLKKKPKDGSKVKSNLVQDLIVKWCCSTKSMHIGIGAKLMTLSLNAADPSEESKMMRKSLSDVLPNIGALVEGKYDDGSTLYSFALAHSIEMINTVVGSTPYKGQVLASKAINSEKVTGLVLHQNSVVRKSVVKFFQTILQLGLDEISSPHESFPESTVGRWMSGDVLRTLISNVCELAKTDPTETLSTCLASIFKLSERGQVSELTTKFVFKKARSIFTHEKFNLKHEWNRRKLYYIWAKEVCEQTESPEMKELVKKFLAKDQRQSHLEDLVNDVMKIIEDSMRRK